MVKMAAPELAHFWHRLGSPRLLEAAKRAGWTDRGLHRNPAARSMDDGRRPAAVLCHKEARLIAMPL